MTRRLSYRSQVALAFALLVALTSALFGIVAARRAAHDLRVEIEANLAALADAVADKLDRGMWARSGEIFTLAGLSDLGVDDPQPEQVRTLLDRLQDSLPVYSWVALIGPDGRVIAATDGLLEGQDISARPVFQEGMRGHFIGDVHEAKLLASLLPSPDGEPVKFVDVAARIDGADGTPRGVLAAHLSWAWAREVSATTLTPVDGSRGIELFVVAADGVVLLGPRNLLVGEELKLDALRQARAGAVGAAVETWPDGRPYLTGFAFGDGHQNFAGLGWTVLARQPVDLAYAPVQALSLTVAGWGVVLTVLVAVGGWIAAGRLTAPVARLTEAADRMRRGHGRDLPDLRSPPEMARLSGALRELVAALTHKERALDQMTDLALVDRLTGLPNRLAFEAALEAAAAAAGREGRPFAVLYLDLDGFKPVNDTHGHDAGDAVLREVGARLRAGLRGGDTAARLGGDEFVMLLAPTPGGASDETARAVVQRVAGRVIDALNQPVAFNTVVLRIGCSIGGVLWQPAAGEPLDALLKRADQALYAAKRGGKNRAVLDQG